MKILYIFTGGRKKRWNKINSGEIPSEFFFGAYELNKKGYEIDILELEEIKKLNKPGRLKKYINSFFKKLTGLSTDKEIFKNSLDQLNQYDHIIASNDFIALSLLPWIKKRKIKPPVIFFAMGQLANTENENLNWLKNKIGKAVYKKLIKNSELGIFLGRGEFNLAQSLVKDKNKIHFLPFAVDTKFWQPNKNIEEENYIFSIGNDKARNWEMAIKLAQRMPEEKFKFISKSEILSQAKLPSNLEHINGGDWKNYILTDEEIKKFYQKCKIVIIPIKETFQPSGQSVCLQAMSCGKPVIISQYKGFWEPEKNKNNIHLIFSENNIDNFCKNIKKLNKNKDLREKIGKNARNLTTKEYDMNSFAKKLLKLIK